MILLGDIHHNFDILVDYLKEYDFENETIVSVGDFGLGFIIPSIERKWLKKLHHTLKKGNNCLYILRGNHDNPDYWTEQKIPFFTNIILVKDYSTIYIEGKNILFIGGAISLDRTRRWLGASYWENEAIVRNDDFMRSLPDNSIDIVITHCPIKRIFRHKFYGHAVEEKRFAKDITLKDDITSEQAILEDYNALLKQSQKDTLKMWVSGHLHISHSVIEDNITYRVIDINEFFEVRI